MDTDSAVLYRTWRKWYKPLLEGMFKDFASSGVEVVVYRFGAEK
jgi:hypothetical protein